ncbi:DUF397 domain-containing protein [Streptomyces sp. GD-15H]|uniref:DUF397 domain-containing protein n=1 Tax=Streptomyces sp. GD-15H TaxID=3129112 RepID=UPI003252A453
MNRKGSVGDDLEPTWFKSSYSDSGNPSDCVEVAMAPDAVLVRDSKTPGGPLLAPTSAAWNRFVRDTGGTVAPLTNEVGDGS